MGITIRENPNGLPDITRHPYLVRCDKPDCYWIVSAVDLTAAELSLRTHICPWLTDMTERIADMAKGMTQYQKMFTLLDGAMDELETAKQMNDSQEQARLKGFMQGLAECIAITMVPIFADRRAVAVEAKLRFDARVKGERHESPGVDYTWRPGGGKGEPIREFIPDSKQQDLPSAAAPRRPAASRRSGAGQADVNTRIAAVDEQVRTAIRKAVASGMFTPDEMASVYNLKTDEVAAILAADPVSMTES